MPKHILRHGSDRISGHAVLTLLEAVRDIGGNIASILRSAGLNNSLDDFQHERVDSVRRDQFTQLYCASMLALEAYAYAPLGKMGMERAESRMLLYCCISARTLHETITRSAEFMAMLDRGSCISCTLDEDMAVVRLTTPQPLRCPASFMCDLVGLSAFHMLYSWMIGERIPVLNVQMAYDASYEKYVFMDLFGVPLTLQGERNEFRFTAALLDRPTVRGLAELEMVCDDFPFGALPADDKPDEIAPQIVQSIYNAILARAPLPGISEIARKLNLSGATLRRRLDEEGTSMTALKLACRRDFAREFLSRDDMTVAEIAVRLGFSDGANFRRAFVSWEGVSPSLFRQRRMLGGSTLPTPNEAV